MGKCRYCEEGELKKDDYIHNNNLIHEKRCSNKDCRALNYSLTEPIKG